MIIRELFALLGFKTDTADAKKFDAILDDLKTKAVQTVSAIVGIGGAIASVRELLDYAGATKDAAARIGITTTALQELDFAAAQGGSSVEAMRAGLTNLGAAAAGVTERGKAVRTLLGTIGVSATDAAGRARPTEAIMLDLADALQRIPDQGTRTAIAMRVLGDAGRDLVPLLNEGRGAIEAMRLEAHELGLVVDGETIEAADELGDKWAAIQGVGQSLSRTFAQGLLPPLRELADRVLAWVRANGALVRSGIRAFADGLASVMRTLVDIGRLWVQALGEIVDGVGGAENAMQGLALALLVLNRGMVLLVAKAAAIGLAFTALALIIGDVFAYSKHGDAVDSLSGRFRKAFIDDPIKPEDVWWVVLLKAIGQGLKQVQDGAQGAALAMSDLADVFTGSREQKLVAGSRLSGFARALYDATLGSAPGEAPLPELGLTEGTAVRRTFRQRSTRLVAPVTPLANEPPLSPLVPTVQVPLLPAAGPSDRRQYNTITVSGVSDASEAAREVVTQLRQANGLQVED